jgi:hypothetical protein
MNTSKKLEAINAALGSEAQNYTAAIAVAEKIAHEEFQIGRMLAKAALETYTKENESGCFYVESTQFDQDTEHDVELLISDNYIKSIS